MCDWDFGFRVLGTGNFLLGVPYYDHYNPLCPKSPILITLNPKPKPIVKAPILDPSSGPLGFGFGVLDTEIGLGFRV